MTIHLPSRWALRASAGDDADVSILLGIKGGGFEPAHNLKLGSLSNQVFLVDMNHDGKLDLVEDGGVALGDGHGSFGNLTPFPTESDSTADSPNSQWETSITTALPILRLSITLRTTPRRYGLC